MSARFKKPRFTERDFEGVGKINVRHIKVGELLDLNAEPDKTLVTLKIIQACIYDGDAPEFASIDEVRECLDWDQSMALCKIVYEVNGIDRKDAEKNSDAPAS